MKRIMAAGAVALAMAVTACGSSSQAGSSNSGTSSGPYRLLAVVATSGAFQAVGQATVDTLKIAVHAVNDSGGINGRTMTLQVIDDQGDATKAVSLLQAQLGGSSPPDAVFAGSTSDETLAMLPVLTARKIFNIGTTASVKINNPAAFPYTFRPQPLISFVGEQYASMFKEKGYKSVGLLTTDDLLGQTSAAAYKAALQGVGIKVYSETYSSTDLDVTAPMSRLAADNPDAVLFSALAPTSPPLVLAARKKVNMTQPIYGDISINADLYNLVPRSEAQNVFLATAKGNTLPPGGDPKALADFITTLKTYGPIKNYMINYTYGYDAVRLIQIAAKLSDSTDAAKMSKALVDMSSIPAGIALLSYSDTRFSPSDHFNAGASPSDFVMQPLGPRVDGQFRLPLP